MSVIIARPHTRSQGVFPQVGPCPYDVDHGQPSGLTPDQRAPCGLLRLASRDFSRWERLWGWKLDAPGKVGRLLLLHSVLSHTGIIAKLERSAKQMV
jgi:hypothetical protein